MYETLTFHGNPKRTFGYYECATTQYDWTTADSLVTHCLDKVNGYVRYRRSAGRVLISHRTGTR